MRPGIIFIISLIVLENIFDTLRELILKTAINNLKIERYTIKNIIAFIQHPFSFSLAIHTFKDRSQPCLLP
jgi:hypothetical protein